jgi:hypothetical protein
MEYYLDRKEVRRIGLGVYGLLQVLPGAPDYAAQERMVPVKERQGSQLAGDLLDRAQVYP